jgi:hypothetical protein
LLVVKRMVIAIKKSRNQFKALFAYINLRPLTSAANKQAEIDLSPIVYSACSEALRQQVNLFQ